MPLQHSPYLFDNRGWMNSSHPSHGGTTEEGNCSYLLLLSHRASAAYMRIGISSGNSLHVRHEAIVYRKISWSLEAARFGV